MKIIKEEKQQNNENNHGGDSCNNISHVKTGRNGHQEDKVVNTGFLNNLLNLESISPAPSVSAEYTSTFLRKKI